MARHLSQLCDHKNTNSSGQSCPEIFPATERPQQEEASFQSLRCGKSLSVCCIHYHTASTNPNIDQVSSHEIAAQIGHSPKLEEHSPVLSLGTTCRRIPETAVFDLNTSEQESETHISSCLSLMHNCSISTVSQSYSLVEVHHEQPCHVDLDLSISTSRPNHNLETSISGLVFEII